MKVTICEKSVVKYNNISGFWCFVEPFVKNMLQNETSCELCFEMKRCQKYVI